MLGQLKSSRTEKVMCMLNILLDLLIRISVAVESWKAQNHSLIILGCPQSLPPLRSIHFSPLCLGQYLCDYQVNLFEMYLQTLGFHQPQR